MRTKTAVRLTGLAARLRERGLASPSGRILRDRAVDGVIPAHQVNYIWHYYEEDEDAIIAALRLSATNPAVKEAT
jgi:hypothetical protein